MAKKKSKYLGSAGIYLCAWIKGKLYVLVHRRGQAVSEPRELATPGGIVTRERCQKGEWGEVDFEHGAKVTAVEELKEETGVRLTEQQIEDLQELDVDDSAYWGKEYHRNYFVVLDQIVEVLGPDRDSHHEIQRNGTDGLGIAAGDGWHSWVWLDELLKRKDLMQGCRTPLRQLAGLVVQPHPDDEVPPGIAWVELKDKQTGATYYASTELFTVQWDFPTTGVVRLLTDPQDESGKKYYYYHTDTGETKWDPPDGDREHWQTRSRSDSRGGSPSRSWRRSRSRSRSRSRRGR